ncbi:MAG: hypothetical protein ACK4Q5_09735 [Saprospiraceae bacterium]
MKVFSTLLTIILACTLATAQQTVWTGAADLNWSNAANWNNGLPTAGITAVIPGSVTTPIQANNLTIDFPVQNFGKIQFTGTVVNTGNFVNFNGATVDNQADFTNNSASQFDNAGRWDNFNKFTNNTILNQTGTGDWHNQPGATFKNSATGSFANNGYFENKGTVTNDGSITTGATIDNHGTLTNNKVLLIGYGTGKLNNLAPNGSVLNAANGTFDVQGLFVNGGTAENQGGFKVSATGRFDNNGTFTNRSVSRNFGLTVNDGTVNNGCTGCDNSTTYPYNDYGAIFRNLRDFNNLGTLELLPCSEFYQKSVTNGHVGGDVWLMAIVYELQGTVDQSHNMGGKVLYNENDKAMPMATCKNATVTLGADGTITILPSLVDDGSMAMYCEIGSMNVTPNSFNCTTTGPRTVTLTVTDAKGVSMSCNATVTVQPSPACQTVCDKDVLFVVGCSNLNSGDTWVKNRLVSLGYNVTVKSDYQVSTSDANGKGLVVISSTVNSGDIGSKFTNVNVPVLTWESLLFDDLKMTGTANGTDYGASNAASLEITNPEHPLAAGLSGSVSLFNYSTSVRWGVPSASALKIAKLPGTSKFGVFAYESGSSMVGLNAPARRVGFFFDDATAACMSNKGKDLFDAAIYWATTCQPPTGGDDCVKKALLVVGYNCYNNLSSTDLAIKNRLVALGLTVTVKSDYSVKTSDATDKGIVVISPSVNSGDVNTKFRNVTVPVLVSEQFLFDDMKMTGTTSNTDFGTKCESKLSIVTTSHPIAGSLTGTVTIAGCSSELGWGKPGAAATIVANIANNTGKSAIFAYEAGANMVGLTAPARRVGFYFRDGSCCSVTSNAWKLFDNSVKWAMNCPNLNNLNLALRQESLTFNAFENQHDVRLNWINNTGDLNDYFIVERSADGEQFEEILRLEGEGAADEMLYFSELDENPLPGDNYYRVRLVFFDGTEYRSDVQKVTMADAQAFEIFPNPAALSTSVSLAPFVGKPVQVMLVNELGIPVRTLDIASATNDPLALDLKGLSNGHYSVYITCNGVKRSNRLIVTVE